MTASFLKLVSILWANRAIIATAIPLVVKAAETFNGNEDKKQWVTEQIDALKEFTPDTIDEGIDAAVHLLKLGKIL